MKLSADDICGKENNRKIIILYCKRHNIYRDDDKKKHYSEHCNVNMSFENILNYCNNYHNFVICNVMANVIVITLVILIFIKV